MSNWQPDDLALCIYQGQWFARLSDGFLIPGTGPRAGQILTVRAVKRSTRGNLCLLFTDFSDATVEGSLGGYRASFFRKVTPPEADQFDREVIADLMSKPDQVPA